MNHYLKTLCFVLCLGFLAGCSSSSSESTTEDSTTTATEDLATFLIWSGATWDSLTPVLDSSSKDISTDFPVSCGGGGTMDLVGSEITLNDCVETFNSITYLARGSYTVTESGSLTTHEWDQDILVDANDDGTFADDEPTFTCAGTISFDTADDRIAYDFTATFADEAIRVTGTVSDNDDGSSDTTFSVLLDDVAWQDGQFDDTDLSSLTDDDVDNACTDDDDPQCDTLECSGDFECQIYAESDQSDEFETGNIECSSGCCALIADVSVCHGSSPCSDDFTCQLFAADDPDDEFTTANSSCDLDTGCCVAE